MTQAYPVCGETHKHMDHLKVPEETFRSLLAQGFPVQTEQSAGRLNGP